MRIFKDQARDFLTSKLPSTFRINIDHDPTARGTPSPDIVKLNVARDGSPMVTRKKVTTTKPQTKPQEPQKRPQNLGVGKMAIIVFERQQNFWLHSSGSEDKEKFYCEEVTASVADIERKMGQLHADLINAEMDRPASIPPDEPYVDLGIIGEHSGSEFDVVTHFPFI